MEARVEGSQVVGIDHDLVSICCCFPGQVTFFLFLKDLILSVFLSLSDTILFPLSKLPQMMKRQPQQPDWGKIVQGPPLYAKTNPKAKASIANKAANLVLKGVSKIGKLFSK